MTERSDWDWSPKTRELAAKLAEKLSVLKSARETSEKIEEIMRPLLGDFDHLTDREKHESYTVLLASFLATVEAMLKQGSDEQLSFGSYTQTWC